MRILDRYILTSILRIFIASILIFGCLYILIDMTANLDEIIDRKISAGILIKYYLSFFPIILVQTSSIACLIATLFTFSRLSNNNEIIAMRASGLNFWKITKPALCFGLIISAFVFWVNEQHVPQATENTKKIRDENMILKADRIRKKMSNIENLTFYGLKNRLYFVDSFNPNTNELNGVTIIEYNDNQNVTQKIVALKGKWTGIAWKFFNCQITSFDEASVTSPVKVKVYTEKLMDIQETPDDFLKQRLNVASMNIKELKSYIDRFSKSGATRALDKLRVDMYDKIAYPFGNFVIVLLGLPFALMVKSRKGTTFASLGIAVAVGFFYYVANAVAVAFGKGGLLPPMLAAWATPLLFMAMAITVIETDFSN